jgi:effector-binding domain-containing protein
MKVREYTVKKEDDGPPIYFCHDISPQAVMEANEKGTAIIEVACPVSGTVKGTREIKVYELPGGKMAHVIHNSPYESCEPTYLKLFTWIKENGFRDLRANPRGLPERSSDGASRFNHHGDLCAGQLRFFSRM